MWKNEKYSIQLYWWEDENCWYACVPEITAIFETGSTRAEALAKLEDLIQDVLEDEDAEKIEPWILRTNEETFPLYLD